MELRRRQSPSPARLPRGLSFHGGTGTASFSGQPTVTGVFRVVLIAGNGAGANATQNLTIDAGFVITTASLPHVAPNAAYNASLSATGGTTPYKWKASGLPKGLKMDKATGKISGTPKSNDLAGTYTVTVSVQDTKVKTGSGAHAKEKTSKVFSLVFS